MAATSSHREQTSTSLILRARRPAGYSYGKSVAAFLAQHISQEIAPKAPGIDRYVLATRAYSQARDINLEVLDQGAGLRIKI